MVNLPFAGYIPTIISENEYFVIPFVSPGVVVGGITGDTGLFGVVLGDTLGVCVGASVGVALGDALGVCVGTSVGVCVGTSVGVALGDALGTIVGVGVGVTGF